MFFLIACPNITGNSYYGLMFAYEQSDSESHTDGAITVNRIDRGNIYGGNPTTRFNLSFDASQSNSIYSNSDTVQPSSINLNVLIKF